MCVVATCMYMYVDVSLTAYPSPEDFVVTELDLSGRPAVIVDSSAPSLPLPQPTACIPAERPHPSTTPPLVELVPEEQYRSLSEMSASYVTSCDSTTLEDISVGEDG